MKLKETVNYFESLMAQTSKKSEIKIYREFIELLNGLENTTLSENEICSIEMELDSFDLESIPTNRKNHFKKVLNQFKSYLSGTFSLTTEGHFSTMGAALGFSFGTLLGFVFFEYYAGSMGISMGMTFGMLIGFHIGRNLDAQAKEKGKMIY